MEALDAKGNFKFWVPVCFFYKMSTKQKTYYKVLCIVAGLFFIGIPVVARRITVKVDKKALDEQVKVQLSANNTDDMQPDVDLTGEKAEMALRLYGYDKPHNASKESVFASNRLTSDTIDAVRFEVDYYTPDNVKLHTRTVQLQVVIPPGESRRLQYPSWDATRTFYYYRTPPRRKEGLSPYKVSMTPQLISVKHIQGSPDSLR